MAFRLFLSRDRFTGVKVTLEPPVAGSVDISLTSPLVMSVFLASLFKSGSDVALSEVRRWCGTGQCSTFNK